MGDRSIRKPEKKKKKADALSTPAPVSNKPTYKQPELVDKKKKDK